MPQDPPSRIPLPPPIDGEGNDTCLEILVAADNAAWDAFQKAYDAATDDTGRALAWLAYLATYSAAVAAYYGCCGVVPPM